MIKFGQNRYQIDPYQSCSIHNLLNHPRHLRHLSLRTVLYALPKKGPLLTPFCESSNNSFWFLFFHEIAFASPRSSLALLEWCYFKINYHRLHCPHHHRHPHHRHHYYFHLSLRLIIRFHDLLNPVPIFLAFPQAITILMIIFLFSWRAFCFRGASSWQELWSWGRLQF